MSARAADVSVQIPRGALDAVLVGIGDVSGKSTWNEPFGLVRCTFTRCTPAGYVVSQWNWRVLSAKFTITSGAAALAITFRSNTGNTTVVQSISVPVTARLDVASNRLIIAPSSSPTAVSFPSVMGTSFAGVIDVAPRFQLEVPLTDTVPLTNLPLSAGVTNATITWGTDALLVSADLRVQ